MFTAIERLRELRVVDVMARTAFTVSPHQTLVEAAQIFAEHEISSAPVIDDEGLCVGILSATDFLKCGSPTEVELRERELVPHDHRVLHRMTNAVQAVSSDSTLLQAARIMCAAHLHRLPVLEHGRIQGVVSTMDIVAALVNAADEIAVHHTSVALG